MADRQTLLTALRNAHNAGDTQAATRIAGMIKALPSQDAQEAPQGATPANPTQPTAEPESLTQDATDTLKSMSRIGAGAVSDIANIGVGAVNAVKSAGAWAGKELGLGDGTYTPMESAGYGNSEFANEYLNPQGTGENIVASIPSYMVGGEIAAPIKAAEGAGRIARAGTALARNYMGADLGVLAEHNQGNDEGVLSDLAMNTVLPAAVERVGGAAVRGVRNVLPEGYGGYSVAQKAAKVANPEYVGKVLQSGDTEAQQAFRTATTDANGNSIVLPSQAFNNEAGNKYIAAESRDMLRGDNSQYNARLAQQQTGEGITQAVADTSKGGTLKESAGDITEQFKKQSSKLYNDSKAQAQDILNSRYVTEMHMNNTKDLAAQHLAEDASVGHVNLNAETRRTLGQLQKTKFDSIDTLDKWKRTLNDKASKAYRNGDYQSSSVLREVSNNLRGEADATINNIDPAAGSIYRDADRYFSESVGDFGSGKKSVLGKMADTDNPAAVDRMLVGKGFNAKFNTANIGDALQNAINKGSLDDADQLAINFGQSLGSTTRQTALDEATTGANFSPTKFANTLNRLKKQTGVASRFSPNEQALNDALLDAVQMTRNKARNVSRVTNMLGNKVGASVGAGIGGATGAALGSIFGPIGTAAGTSAGGLIGGVVTDAIGKGLFDRLTGTLGRGNKYINFLSDPANAQKVSDILANQGGLNAPIEAIKNAVDALTQSTASNYSSISDNSVQPAPIANVAPIEPDYTPEPVQHAQVAKVTSNADNFDSKTTRLYKALAHAETGGLDNRFIRTKAAESGVSTAYGAAQLTTNTLKDFYQRHPNLFNAVERDYINRFIEQGNQMKRADKNDPVYGYGGTGVLGGKQDRKLYANVVRKMLQQMIKDNGGSLDKTVMQWRGNKNDHAYFSKVREAFRSA